MWHTAKAVFLKVIILNDYVRKKEGVKSLYVSLSFFKKIFIYLFIFGCIGSLLLHVGFL